MSTILYHWINFILLFGFLAFVLRKRLSSFYQAQRKDLEAGMNEAKAEHDKIKKEYDEIKTLSSNLDARISKLKETYSKEMAHETLRIKKECEAFVSKTQTDAATRIKVEADKANQSFQKDLLAAALIEAKKTLQKNSEALHKIWTDQMVHSGSDVTEKKNYGS